MLQSPRSLNLSGAASDHNRQLALIVHELHAFRPAGHTQMSEQGAGAFEKYQWFLLGLGGQLLGMVGVVEPERNHGAGLERRQPHHLGGGHAPAVGESHIRQAPICRRRIVNGTGEGDARVHHAAASRKGLRRLPSPSISILSGLARAHANGGRSGADRQHVPRRQRHEFGDVRQQPCRRTDQIGGTRGLHQDVIEIGANGQGVGIRDCGARGDRRSQRAIPVPRLVANRRAVKARMRNAHVGDDQISRHVLQRPRCRIPCTPRARSPARGRRRLRVPESPAGILTTLPERANVLRGLM